MRKTLPLLLLLLALGAGVYFFVLRDRGEEAFSATEAGFTIKDTAAIGSITLTERSGPTITVRRGAAPSGWVLPGGEPALRSTIGGVLHTLYNQYADRPVPREAHNGVIKTLAGQNIRVDVRNRAGGLMRSFFVGGEAHAFQGTYMLVEGAARPFIVNMTGFAGVLTPRYPTSLYDWRDRTVFDVPPVDVISALVRYETDTARSFSITRTGAGVRVEVPGYTPATAPNLRRAESYLGFFQNVNMEGYITGKEDTRESIAGTERRAVIEVRTKAGAPQVVEVYWMPVNRRSKNFDDSTAAYDGERYFAILHGGRDTALIQERSFQKILRDGREFFSE